MAEVCSEINFENKFDDSDPEWQDEDPIYPNDIARKCGEIILLADTNFWFVCSFCDERFLSIVIFRKHIKGLHIADAVNVPDSNEEENPLDVSLSKSEFSMKIGTDSTNGNCNSNVDKTNNLIPKLNSRESIEKFKLYDDKEIWQGQEDYDHDISNYSEDATTETRQTFEKSNVENEALMDIPYNKDNKKLVIASHNIPKKRNRKKKIHSCSICQHIARDKKSLDAHLQSNHETGTRHQCEECGKCFRNATNLKSHLVIHTGTRPYKCDSCDSGFSHYNSLKLHRYLHTGERPHKCNQCDKGFVSTSALKNHLREHTGEIPYVCEVCDRGFTTQCSYKRHMISHSGHRAFECQQCGRAFLHKETLTKHMACHLNEKKFICDICSKKFNHKKNLVQHQKLHLNVKQYICDICNKEFAQYAGLYSHMKYHKIKE